MSIGVVVLGCTKHLTHKTTIGHTQHHIHLDGDGTGQDRKHSLTAGQHQALLSGRSPHSSPIAVQDLLGQFRYEEKGSLQASAGSAPAEKPQCSIGANLFYNNSMGLTFRVSSNEESPHSGKPEGMAFRQVFIIHTQNSQVRWHLSIRGHFYRRKRYQVTQLTYHLCQVSRRIEVESVLKIKYIMNYSH